MQEVFTCLREASMTPQEQELISQLFARLRQTSVQQQDREAAELIRRLSAEQPDAAYKLVQTALVQDMALNQAQARIAELEKRVVDADAAQPAQRSGFLPQQPALRSGGPWGRSEPMPAAAPPAAAMGAAPMAANPMAGGGGFLRTAAATAMGVIGGSMLFQGIQSMFGHDAGSALAGQAAQPSLTESAGKDAPGTQVADSGRQDWDPATEDTSDMDIASAEDWGGDDGGDFA
jgi:hypothetical protein